MIRRTVKNALIIIAIILIIWFFRAQFVNVEHTMITVNVPVNSSVEDVEAVMDVFTARDASGTFFVPGVWAEINPDLIRRIAAEHELACYTYSERRLAPLNGSALARELDCSGFENLTGTPVIGFRAPANDIGKESYPLLAERYTYDSSLYRRYEWFWPEQTAVLEVPVTSVLLLPLDDWFGINVLHLGDFYYWVAKKAKQEPVVIAVTIGTVNEHLLELEYLIASYQADGANVTTIRDWLNATST